MERALAVEHLRVYTPDGPEGPSGLNLKRILKLSAWVGGIVFFFLVIGPWGSVHIPYFNDTAAFIEENDIQANEYFYTEVPEFLEAQHYFQSLWRFTPGEME